MRGWRLPPANKAGRRILWRKPRINKSISAGGQVLAERGRGAQNDRNRHAKVKKSAKIVPAVYYFRSLVHFSPRCEIFLTYVFSPGGLKSEGVPDFCVVPYVCKNPGS